MIGITSAGLAISQRLRDLLSAPKAAAPDAALLQSREPSCTVPAADTFLCVRAGDAVIDPAAGQANIAAQRHAA